MVGSKGCLERNTIIRAIHLIADLAGEIFQKRIFIRCKQSAVYMVIVSSKIPGIIPVIGLAGIFCSIEQFEAVCYCRRTMQPTRRSVRIVTPWFIVNPPDTGGGNSYNIAMRLLPPY